MADNASIARPYAKAVFDLAQESGSFESWSAALEHLAAISRDESFQTLVLDPRTNDSRVVELLADLSKDSLPEGGTNFVKLLVQNDRLGSLTDIGQQYEELVAKAKAIVNAEVITAIALTDDQKASLSSALETRLGMKVSLAQTIDASLVGGAVVKAGDMVIDGSAKGRIEKLTTTLMR
ncbi:F0F1 ATP synthase subunit delta [Arenicella xantha]|uniref:ATP synthase subunit delta n=1 Tax=Arenicella xantha TaxID=644221 RepID=A0A395JQG6_9GAMM|nr:F0F1 ATP synthase subunit delta [Arenicella xantha]RBP53787.1 F-type H+-transporting ATPase subunit delta [Arenicella xantha]